MAAKIAYIIIKSNYDGSSIDSVYLDKDAAYDAVDKKYNRNYYWVTEHQIVEEKTDGNVN